MVRLCIVSAFVDTDPPVNFRPSIVILAGILLMYIIHCILLSSGPITVHSIVPLPPKRPLTLAPVVTVKLPKIEITTLVNNILFVIHKTAILPPPYKYTIVIINRFVSWVLVAILGHL